MPSGAMISSSLRMPAKNTDKTSRLSTCGKHAKKIVDVPSGTVIPIPIHGKYVQEAYIKELKDLFAEIENGSKEVE